MTVNFPGPLVVEIVSTVDGLTHKMALNAIPVTTPPPGTPATSIDVVQRNSATIALDQALDAFVTLMLGLFPTTYTFDYANIYTVPPQSFERAFVSSWTLGLVGESVEAYSPGITGTFTWHTQEGGVHKLVLTEVAATSLGDRSYSELGAAGQNIANYVGGPSGWIVARDTSYPFGFMKYRVNFHRKLVDLRYSFA